MNPVTHWKELKIELFRAAVAYHSENRYQQLDFLIFLLSHGSGSYRSLDLVLFPPWDKKTINLKALGALCHLLNNACMVPPPLEVSMLRIVS